LQEVTSCFLLLFSEQEARALKFMSNSSAG